MRGAGRPGRLLQLHSRQGRLRLGAHPGCAPAAVHSWRQSCCMAGKGGVATPWGNAQRLGDVLLREGHARPAAIVLPHAGLAQLPSARRVCEGMSHWAAAGLPPHRLGVQALLRRLLCRRCGAQQQHSLSCHTGKQFHSALAGASDAPLQPLLPGIQRVAPLGILEVSAGCASCCAPQPALPPPAYREPLHC